MGIVTFAAFSARLASLGLRQADFIRQTGLKNLHRWRVSRFGVPPWVPSWLDLKEENIQLRAELRARAREDAC